MIAEVASRPAAALVPARADLRVSPERMLRIQGYTDMARVRRPIRAAAERCAELAESLLAPRVVFRRVAIEARTGDGIDLEGGARLRSPAFARFLASAREIAPFVLTAGPGIDAEIQRLNADGQLLDVLFLETAGWLGVEAITKAFVVHLRARAGAEGLRLTRRMGPGYTYRTEHGDAQWPLEDQPALFDLFDPEDLPVRMLESCAMVPKMSRSGLVGLVPAMRPAPQPAPRGPDG